MESVIKFDSGRDKASLAVCFDHAAPRLRRMAWYYARRLRLDGDDLLQEACRGLIEGWQKLDPRIGSPPQFLIRCARWRLLSYARKCRRHPTFPLEQDTAQTDRELEAMDVALDLESAAHGLTGVQRQVVDCLLAGMTWREAGDAMGCTSANIAYHVRSIRRALSDCAASDDRADEGDGALERRCPMKVTGKMGGAL